MLFNSYAFIFCFLPLFLCAWQITAACAARKAHALGLCLLAFSLLFYGMWGGLLFPLFLLAMAGVNHAFGLAICHAGAETSQSADGIFPLSAKRLLILALCLNLLPLAWFKYSGFIIENLAMLLGADWRFTQPEQPLGISFCAFIQIAWLVGIYRRQIKPAGLARHAAFTTCFAYVISGPIVRYDQVGWQMDQLKGVAASGLARGISLFSIGLAKKAILADSLAIYANSVFNAAEKNWPISGLEAWLGSFCYSFQLYFDFSGYTDMAIGAGLMIGLRLPENFHSPYKATGIVDFWRRWHITLSSWLRDFLYIPLGGNRHGKLRQYRNLFLTMLIGGAWHGAGWTFIVWGAAHGLMLGANHFFRAKLKLRWSAPAIFPVRLISIAFTFLCLNFCWVVFRAKSLDAAMTIYKAMFKNLLYLDPAILDRLLRPSHWAALAGQLLPNHYFQGWQPFALLLAAAVICWGMPNSHEIFNGRRDGSRPWLFWQPGHAWAACLALLAVAALTFLSRQTSFLYFQF